MGAYSSAVQARFERLEKRRRELLDRGLTWKATTRTIKVATSESRGRTHGLRPLGRHARGEVVRSRAGARGQGNAAEDHPAEGHAAVEKSKSE